ncbi:MAG: hypothetical protein RR413_11625 [Christensenellaceae bacterium]
MGCSMVNVENRNDIGRMIPTWQVLYQLNIKYENGQQVQYDLCTLFSAIDGSYVEPRIEQAVFNALF